ncbi:MAG: hypothetical protein AAF682_11175 [Planctomycetota bacterium]
MGSRIEINDTLKLQREAGFPERLSLGAEYPFRIQERRLYHLDPVRVLLVEEVEGLWNFRGHALIQELTIDARSEETRGVFRVSRLYTPEVALQLNRVEAPEGRGLLDPDLLLPDRDRG